MKKPQLARLLSRRDFVNSSSILALGFFAAPGRGWGQSGKYRAAILGHTGAGNYGHSLEAIFTGLDGIEVAAVSDPVAEARTRVSEKTGASKHYADYREMLEKEKPNLVSIGSRWTDQRLAMSMASLRAGAHLFVEKPFVGTLEEGDQILAEAGRRGLKIAVAHQMRLSPSILRLKSEMENGLLGDLLQMRAYGKQDARAGGEDMMVLGTHLFDLMRFFGANPLWCSARVLQEGREITRESGREPTEKIGLVAGNDIEAQFSFPQGILGSFTSRGRMRDQTGHWGIELIGSKRSARILADVYPAIHLREPGKWDKEGQNGGWKRWEKDPSIPLSAAEKSFEPANRRVVEDWLKAIKENREPICSGRAGLAAVEMVMAVYQAAIAGKRVAFPLTDRKHPLGK